MNHDPIWRLVDEAAPRFRALSDRIWAIPETCYGETASAQAHADELQAQGFDVTQGVAGIPTALVGHAGHSGPVIAFLGEYDALAGLSQVADLAEPTPLSPGGNGHGCGHNLLGSAAMLAATALRDWLAETGTPGQVRYYGCPAEEGGAAKAFMVRDGAFDDVDIAISWHPHCIPAVMRGSSLSNARIDFTFTGRASHAAMSPELGRSALDAAELMNVGVNYLREHMPDSARIHYAYIDAGGISPNVVQGQAHLRYVVRDVTARRMLALAERVRKVAQGAALMTETTVSDQVLAAVSNLVENTPLVQAMQRHLDRLGPPHTSEVDRAYATRFQTTFDADDIRASYDSVGAAPRDALVLPDFVVPGDARVPDMGGSTDVADVSWVVPTVQMWGANYAIGTPFHSWQMVAQGKSNVALNGMVHAAMVMAATGAQAVTDSDLRDRAWQDLRARTGPDGYVSPLPADALPPIREMA
ncbi:MAG: amidohydrolase [Marinibacterium sp.]|nr:amidohydrolase [Marinibacterium sp.]